MKARMRIVLMLVGMVFALVFNAANVGCSSSSVKATVKFKHGHHSLKMSTADGVVHYEYVKALLPDFSLPLHFDLDSKKYAYVGLSNLSCKYFFDNDCVYEEESHQLFLNDDPLWSEFYENSELRSHITTEDQYLFSIPNGLEIEGNFSTLFGISTGPQSGHVEVSVNLEGGSPIPFWDTYRWQTLDRKLFLFPDGVYGNPDPIVMRLTGEANDVFGYLFEVGITEGSAIVDGNLWEVCIDQTGECADIFVNDILINSISLN